jgi:ferredoxin
MNTDIAVDAVRCTGHGVCALLLPDHVSLDRWGFPVVEHAEAVGRRDARRARRAQRACPRQALLVADHQPPS